MICRFTSASDHQRLRMAMKRWRAWHQWWKSRRRGFLQRMARIALASAVSRWRLGASATRSRHQGAVHLLESLLPRKCLLALANNACVARVLRRMLGSYRRRTLRDVWEAWGLFLVSQEKRNKTSVTTENPARCVTARRQRRHPGKPRKVHCRCVYAVSRGQHCTCAPRSHLLRRVEELHRLVASGLDGRDGGHRLLSHVVQRTSPPSHAKKGRSTGRILSPPRDSEKGGKAGCDDRQQGVTAPRVRLAGGGKVCGPRSTRCGSDKSPRAGTCKPATSHGMEDTDSYRASITQDALLVDELTGVAVPPVVAGGLRCVRMFLSLRDTKYSVEFHAKGMQSMYSSFVISSPTSCPFGLRPPSPPDYRVFLVNAH